MTLYVVSYDICDDGNRQSLADFLEENFDSLHIQESVFMVNTDIGREKLSTLVSPFTHESDSLFIVTVGDDRPILGRLSHYEMGWINQRLPYKGG